MKKEKIDGFVIKLLGSSLGQNCKQLLRQDENSQDAR